MTWKTKEKSWYHVGHVISTLITLLLFRPIIKGKHNIPKSGAILVTPNHRSMLDIPLLGCTTFRPLRFMAKKELFKSKFVKWYFETNGSFSVDKQEGDPASIKKAISILKDGDALVVFPEGKRSKREFIGELAPGACFLAVKANAPLLPIAVAGADGPYKRKYGIFPVIPRAKVVIGEPITSHINSEGKTSEIVAAITSQLHNKLQKLYDEALLLTQS